MRIYALLLALSKFSYPFHSLQHQFIPWTQLHPYHSRYAKGLNIPVKRSQIFASMYSMKADIIFMQEIHFKSKSTPKLENPHVYHSTSPTSKTKGTYILLLRNLPLQISDTLADEQGHYIFIKGMLSDKPITLANIYTPFTSQVPFCRLLSSFPSGILILGGDFNVPLDPLIDTSTGTSHLPYSALQQIKLFLQELSLHDIWRTLHPHDKDYTYFSAPHNKYWWLDYLFLSQPDLPYLSKTVEPMFNSDHRPITLC